LDRPIGGVRLRRAGDRVRVRWLGQRVEADRKRATGSGCWRPAAASLTTNSRVGDRGRARSSAPRGHRRQHGSEAGRGAISGSGSCSSTWDVRHWRRRGSPAAVFRPVNLTIGRLRLRSHGVLGRGDGAVHGPPNQAANRQTTWCSWPSCWRFATGTRASRSESVAAPPSSCRSTCVPPSNYSSWVSVPVSAEQQPTSPRNCSGVHRLVRERHPRCHRVPASPSADGAAAAR
jgi:hypothetical protein